ncbi:asparaginase [Gordoniibacillus kamchatkensis]|uniref:Asparaginase n=1 Tax=Gordoniibacillus kamchatkensis TaxID=1590651 RepID=A0ABR5AMD2_9BACL|nr:asparaginase [Paenibacillus sp. VKM B-2647]
MEESRNGALECVHSGHICGVGADGEVRYAVGDADYVAFLRSSGKPVQAIPVFKHGVPAKYGLTEKEMAIMMGSHRAEPFHVEALEGLLAKLGLSESHLVCKPTYPLGIQAKEDVIRSGGPQRSIYHNCSGKHLGTLALCKAMGYPLEDYYDISHPAQQEILSTLAYLSEYPRERITLGTDGCGFPVFAIPLRNLAKVYLKLACPELIDDVAVRSAVETIVRLMNDHYEMIAGTDRICSALLMDPNIVAKGGAKGIYCFGLKREKLGFAFKVLDGSEDEWPLIAASILEQIGYPGRETIDRMYALAPQDIVNDNGKVVGMNKAVFRMENR